MTPAPSILDPAVFLPPLTGGMMIGLGAALMIMFLGRVTGVSGIIASAISPSDGANRDVPGYRAWRWAFILGLIVAAPLFALIGGDDATGALSSPAILAVAGLLVGVGASVGSGCTSGHGVCGLARLSWRSAIATGTFMATAAITVLITRHVIGG